MKIETARFEILTNFSQVMCNVSCDIPGVTITETVRGIDEMKMVEQATRTCYKSEGKITEDSAEALIRGLIASGHEAMLEFGHITVRFICDRAFSHELVRHRMASFAQESQRYCNYSKGRFGSEVTFILPWWMEPELDIGYKVFEESCKRAEEEYFKLLDMGYTPQCARLVLPNCTKTEVVMDANYREWRHILKLRTAPNAHPDMRHIMNGLLKEFKEKLPVFFEDINPED